MPIREGDWKGVRIRVQVDIRDMGSETMRPRLNLKHGDKVLKDVIQENCAMYYM